MEIFFAPEVITPEYQILNVVNSEDKALGNIAFLFDEKKLYVYGILEEEGVSENFKSMVHPYIKGFAKAKPELEIYTCLYIGCKKISLNGMDNEENNQKK